MSLTEFDTTVLHDEIMNSGEKKLSIPVIAISIIGGILIAVLMIKYTGKKEEKVIKE